MLREARYTMDINNVASCKHYLQLVREKKKRMKINTRKNIPKTFVNSAIKNMCAVCMNSRQINQPFLSLKTTVLINRYIYVYIHVYMYIVLSKFQPISTNSRRYSTLLTAEDVNFDFLSVTPEKMFFVFLQDFVCVSHFRMW